MKPFKNTKLMTFGLTVALLFSGCVKDSSETPRPDKGGKDVLFSINIPGTSKSSTRAMSDHDESRVKSIEVLLFKNGKVASNPAFTSSITTDPDADGSYNKKSFSVHLPEGTFDIMIFANSLDAFKKASIALHDDQETTLAKLKALMPSTGWVADGSDASHIPMWGMREGQKIEAATKITNMYLHRMLSRIDISVTGADTKTGNFKLRDIKLYNVQKEGRIAPVMANWDKDGKINEGQANEQLAGKTTAPSLTSSGVYPTGISYQSVIATDEKSCTREMYLFEAPKATVDGDLTAPYITVLGEYEGVEGWYRIDLANYLTMTYLDVLRNHLYKIQIDQVSGTGYAEEEDAKKSRDTNIVINVTLWNDYDMGGTVFDGAHFVSITPQDVEYTKEMQVSQKIVIKTDLGTTLTTSSIKLSDSDRNPDAGFATAWIKNVALGISATVENRKVYELTYDVEVNNASPRVAYIYVTANSRLTNVVRVKQSDKTKNLLAITDGNDLPITEMLFAAAAGVAPDEQIFKVKWAPTSQILYSSTEALTNPKGGYFPLPSWVKYLAASKDGIINLNSAPNIYVADINNISGEMTFNIKPKAISAAEITADPFFERQVEIKYRIATPEGLLHQNVVIQQMVPNMVPKAEGHYLANSSTYTFNVKSNRPWKAYLIDNGGGMVTSPTVSTTIPIATGGYNLPDGANVDFKTFDDLSNLTIILGTAKVKIEWLSGDDPANSAHWTTASDLDLLCGSTVKLGSNCYMVNGTTPIEIPTRQVAFAMGLNDKPTEQAATDGYLGMGWITPEEQSKLKADLLWTDIPKMLGEADAVVKSVSYGGGHIVTGIITVIPGIPATGGNAVICLYVDNNANDKYDTGDIIKWSWHIWNADAGADYYPYNASGAPNTDWMDRNLGATANIGSDVSSRGFLYQWGRKDPTMGAKQKKQPEGSVSGNYYLSDNTLTTGPPWPKTGASLLESVQSPLTGWYDWSGSFRVGGSTNKSWDNVGAKTVFDPCPDGYRVPVRGTTNHWGTETGSIGNSLWTAEYGINWSTKGGYYPAAGCRDAGALYVVGSYGYYWSASPGDSQAYLLYLFNGTDVYPNASNNRFYGFSVRCVAVE